MERDYTWRTSDVETAIRALKRGVDVYFDADADVRARVVSIQPDGRRKWLVTWTHPDFDTPQLERLESYHQFFFYVNRDKIFPDPEVTDVLGSLLTRDDRWG